VAIKLNILKINAEGDACCWGNNLHWSHITTRRRETLPGLNFGLVASQSWSVGYSTSRNGQIDPNSIDFSFAIWTLRDSPWSAR